MASTKKVANSVRAKKASSSSKKVTLQKKTAQTKQSPQLTLTAVKKQPAVRVKIANKTKKNVSSSKDTPIASKLARVEALHAKKESKAAAVKFPPLKQERSTYALALLSPYRFPVSVDQIAHGAARFGGVFFVIVGAFFTLFFASSSFSGTLQSASLTSSTLSVVQGTLSGCSGSGSCDTVNTKPEVSFDISGGEPLAGSVEVRVKVDNASHVKLMAYNKTLIQNLTLGTLTKKSDNEWVLQWDTTRYDDGEYKLKAFVENQYGSYEVADDSYIAVENKPMPENTLLDSVEKASDVLDDTTSTVEQIADTTLDSETVTDSTTDETAEDPDEVTSTSVTLSSDKKEASDYFRFEISAPHANKVKIYSQNVKSNERRLLGYAYSSDSQWKFKWLLTGINAGEYVIQSYALIDGNEAASNELKVKVIAATAVSAVASTTSTITQQAENVEMTPSAAIKIHAPTPLRSVVPVQIAVAGAKKIEMYAIPHNSLIERYIGTAHVVDDTIWKFEWDTRLIPNGEYKLKALITNAYGSYAKEISAGKVQNEVLVTYTQEQQEKIKVLTDIAAENPVPVATLPPAPATVPVEEDSVTSDEGETEANIEIVAASPEPTQKEDALRALLNDFHTDIDEELQRLAAALRMKDASKIGESKARLENLKARITRSDLSSADESTLIAEVDAYLKDAIVQVEKNVEKVEKVLVERTKEKAVADSDSDGISDYDEVNLYGTDPFAVDSDNDGFQDGAEILSGYNPIDAASEVLIAYESPKETGIVREDILKVSSVISAQKNEEEDETPAAIISGVALPNSFVTLYIFSTPIVVTIKTEADGSWAYRFEKELEDGEHEVYVGVTDNAGRIVAKSEPFSFVKEAEAFSGTNVTAVANTEESAGGSFASQYMVYLVISISVVAIGLVLILLGLHLDAQPRRNDPVLKEKEAV